MVGSPRIMVVGDSISQGSAGDFTWRYRLHEHLRSVGVTPDMVGVRRHLYDNVADSQSGPDRMAYVTSFDCDHSALWGQQAWERVAQIEAEVRSAQPDLVLILLGINDVVDGHDPTGSLRQIIRNARAGAPTGTFVIGHLVPTEIEGRSDQGAFRDRVRLANDGISALAATMSTSRSPIRIADTRADFDPTLHTYDGVHPNSRGEVRIAAAFADALAGLGVGTPYPRPLSNPPLGPRTPPLLTGSQDGFTAHLSWSKVPGALQYQVHRRLVGYEIRKRVGDGDWVALGSTQATTFDDVGLAGGRHGYQVRGYTVYGQGPWSATASVSLP